jgi:transposase
MSALGLVKMPPDERQEIVERAAAGKAFFSRWISWAKRSRLEPMKDVARTMQKHRESILAWLDSHISNGLI